MQTEADDVHVFTQQCEAVATMHPLTGERCCFPGDPLAVDGEIRELCWAHRNAVIDGTYEVEFIAFVELATDEAAQ